MNMGQFDNGEVGWTNNLEAIHQAFRKGNSESSRISLFECKKIWSGDILPNLLISIILPYNFRCRKISD